MSTSAELLEVFEFLANDREDVRKMAAQGLAQHSKDNAELNALLLDKKHAQCATRLVELLSPTKLVTLGDVLTTLINVTCEAMVAEVFVGFDLIDTLMRLLDGIARSDVIQPPLAAALSEMALMLLNNMTAAHLAAVDDFLQVKDEDLRGFHLARMHTHFRRACDADDDEEAASDGDAAAPGRRTRRRLAKWHLQICVNVTRSKTGQVILAQDDDWVTELVSCLGAPESELRLLAADVFRNTSFEQETHEALIEAGLIRVLVQRLVEAAEPEPVIRLKLAETLAFMLQTERGMQTVETLNAKKLLTGALDALDDDTREFVSRQILPFLDDITDAYVVQGTTHDDLD